MKAIELFKTLLVVFLLVTFNYEAHAQTKDVFNNELFGKEHIVIGQKIDTCYISIALPNGTSDFQRGNLARLFYKPYGSSSVLNTVMFVCSTSHTEIKLRSVNESAEVLLNKMDAIKSISLFRYNLGEDQKKALYNSCP